VKANHPAISEAAKIVQMSLKGQKRKKTRQRKKQEHQHGGKRGHVIRKETREIEDDRRQEKLIPDGSQRGESKVEN